MLEKTTSASLTCHGVTLSEIQSCGFQVDKEVRRVSGRWSFSGDIQGKATVENFTELSQRSVLLCHIILDGKICFRL